MVELQIQIGGIKSEIQSRDKTGVVESKRLEGYGWESRKKDLQRTRNLSKVSEHL